MSALLLRARLFLVLARPPLLLLLALSGALGAASAGASLDPLPALRAVVVVVPFVVYAVSLNDLVDVAVDRINLAGAASRPLASGTAVARQVRATAAVALGLALAASAWVGPLALAVTAAGLLVATAYSLPPLRLSRRGFLAPLALPLGMLAVPFVVGVDAAGGRFGPPQAVLLATLYVGFVGRLLLKDFRDVRGDALLGKRTFLVRHGRGATCALSGVLWVAGSAALLAVPSPSVPLVVCWTATLAVALVLLQRLARPSSHRRDERLVSGIAQCGRTLVVLLLVHLALVEQGSAGPRSALLLGLTTAALLASALEVARHGPSRSSTSAARPVTSRAG